MFALRSALQSYTPTPSPNGAAAYGRRKTSDNLPHCEKRVYHLDASHRSGFSGSTSIASCSDDSLTHGLNLPPCDINIFDGYFLSWPTFRDFFSSNETARDIYTISGNLQIYY